MNKLLLLSHGTMAEGMKRAAKMIIGDKIQLDTLCLSEDKSIVEFKTELEAILLNYQKAETNYIILADLQGGSPYTSALELLSNMGALKETTVISGMNLALVISLAFITDFSEKPQIQLAIDEAKSTMKYFEIIEETDEDL